MEERRKHHHLNIFLLVAVGLLILISLKYTGFTVSELSIDGFLTENAMVVLVHDGVEDSKALSEFVNYSTGETIESVYIDADKFGLNLTSDYILRIVDEGSVIAEENVSVAFEVPSNVTEPESTSDESTENISLEKITLQNETLEENATFSNDTLGLLEESVIQHKAEINKPVEWTKKIKFNETKQDIEIELPEEADNIIIINEKGGFVRDAKLDGVYIDVPGSNLLTGNFFKNFFAITGNFITGFFVYEEENLNKTLVIEEPITEVEINYTTPSPIAVVDGNKITISSDISYTNVSSYMDINFSARRLILYHIIDGAKVDVSKDVSYQVRFLDLNNDSLVERIEWVTPHLSNQTFEVSISVLNVQSYPSVGGNWTVMFNTSGKADLLITAVNGTLFGADLEFLELKCGSTLLNPEFNGSSVYISDYECSELGYETSRVLSAGRHHLRFDFGNETAYAHNLATYPWLNYSWISPEIPRANETLTCYNGTIASDDTNSAVRFYYEWSVNGQLVYGGWNLSTLSPDYFAKGDTILCNMIPNNGSSLNGTSVNNSIWWRIDDYENDFNGYKNGTTSKFGSLSFFGGNFSRIEGLMFGTHLNNLTSLGENGTHIVDESPFSNNATIRGSANGTLSGMFDGGYWMNGSGYFIVPNSPSLNVDVGQNVSICVWFNPISVGDVSQKLFYKVPSSPVTGYAMEMINNRLLFSLYNSGTTYLALDWAGVTAGWHHGCAVLNGSSAGLYYDGALVTSSGGISLLNWSNSDPLYIGQDWVLDPYYGFNGTLDEITILNRSLSAIEVESLYRWNRSEYVSPVIDLGKDANEVNATWTIQNNSNTNLSFRFRTSVDNISWSSWKGVGNSTSNYYWENNKVVNLSYEGNDVRFLQYWVYLQRSNYSHTSLLDQITLKIYNYTTLVRNTKPQIANLTLPLNNSYVTTKSPLLDFFELGDTDFRINRKNETMLKGWHFNGSATTMQGNTAIPLCSSLKTISYWKAEDNANDKLGTHNGTSQGGASYAAGKIELGQAFNLNGTNYFKVSDSTDFSFASEYTIAAWINPKTLSTNRDPIIGTFFNTDGFVLGMWENGVATGITSNELASWEHYNVTGSDYTPQTNAWIQIVYVRAANSMTFYVNGSLVKNVTFVPLATPTNGGYLTIGDQGQTGAVNMFNGSIDEVALFNKSLEGSEVNEMYNRSIAGQAYCKITQQDTPETESGVTYGIGISGSGVLINLNDSLRYSTNLQSGEYITNNNGTVEFWVKPSWSGVDASARTFLKFGNATDGIRIAKEANGFLNFSFLDGGVNIGPSGANVSLWRADDWHHVLVTWKDVANAQLYVDGVLKTSNVAFDTNGWGSGNTYLNIGYQEIGEQCNCTIDELATYSGYFNTSQASTSYSRENTTYHFQISNFSNFSSLVVDANFTTSNYSFGTQLADRAYYWRVRVNDRDNYTDSLTAYANESYSEWSETKMFTVDTIGPGINFSYPTLAHRNVSQSNSVQANISLTNVDKLGSFVWNWNGTNHTMYDSSLILMLNFDNRSLLGENDTYVVDMSQYSNNGSVSGASVNATSAKYNKAFSFDGVNDYINLSKRINFTTFTVSAWFRIYASGVHPTARLIEGGSGANDFRIVIDTTTRQAAFKSIDGNAASSNNSYQIGQWYHLAITRNSSNFVSIYLNGVLNDTGTDSAPISDELLIGNSNSLNRPFDGDIDELYIWNRSLSSAEINQSYMSNLYKYDNSSWVFYTNQSGMGLGLGYGNYSYFGFVNDSLGFTNQTATHEIELRDLTPPVIYLAGPYNNTVHNTTWIVFNFTYIDTSPETCELWGNWSGGWARKGSNTTLTSGINNTLGANVSDGKNWTWNVWCNDSFLLTSWASFNISFSVDSAGPNISFVNLSDETGDLVNATHAVYQQGNLTFYFNITDVGNRLQSAWINIWQTLKNGIILFQGGLTNLGGGIWNITAPLNLTWTNLGYNYTIYANDTLGNINSWDGNFSVNITSLVTIVNLNPSTGVDENEVITLDVRANYSSEVTSGISWNVTIENTDCINLSATYAINTWQISCKAPNLTSTGNATHPLVVKAIFNNFGNIEATSSTTIYYTDIFGPSIVTYSPINSTLSTSTNVSINVTLYDDTAVNSAKVGISFLNTTVVNYTMANITANIYPINWNFSQKGDYILDFVLNDSLGNSRNVRKYYETFEIMGFNGTISGANNTRMSNINFTFYRPNSTTKIHHITANTSGNYNETIHNRTYDLEIKAFGKYTIILEDVDFSVMVNDPIDLDLMDLQKAGVLNSKNLQGIAVSASNELQGKKGSIKSEYDYSKVDNPSNVNIYRCGIFNYSGLECSSGWISLSSPTRSFSSVTVSISNFSAYLTAETTLVISETNIYQSGGGGGTTSTVGLAKTEDVSKLSSEIRSLITNISMGEVDLAGISFVGTTISRDLYPGEDSTIKLLLKNKLGNDAAIISSVEGEIKGTVFLENPLLTIPAGSTKDLIVKMFVPYGTTPGNYDGEIKITHGSEEFKIPINLRVLKSAEKLLDIKVQPVTDTIKPGETLRIHTDIYNLGKEKRVDVQLHLQLVDPDTYEVVTMKEEAIAVETTISVIKSLDIPKKINLGKYIIKGIAYYSNDNRTTLQASSIAYVEIKKSIWDYKFLGLAAGYYAGFLLVVALIWGIYLWWGYEQAKKRRYLMNVDFKKLPQPGRSSLFMGKVVETDVRTFFDIDQFQTHTLIAGSTGGGKTITAQDLVEEALMKGISVIVFDPTAQWTGFLRKCEDKPMLDRYKYFEMKKNDAKSFAGNIRVITDAREVIDVKRFMNPGEITIFTMNRLSLKEMDTVVASTIQQIFGANFNESPTCKLLMVYDEVHRLLPQYGGGGEGLIQIERACREFRKWGIGLVLISQVLSDFVGAIKANIATDIQMRTRHEGDLERINMKYGEDITKSLVRSAISVGMVENTQYNNGRPYFVSFRPIMHNTKRLTDAELDQYAKYNEIIDDLMYQVDQLEALKLDVFDLRLELKLALGKIRTGQFTMVDIYLESLRPRVVDAWRKIGKMPQKKAIKLISEEDIKTGIKIGQIEREKFEKERVQSKELERNAVNYIKQALGKGITADKIKQGFVNAGWPEDRIESLIKNIQSQQKADQAQKSEGGGKP